MPDRTKLGPDRFTMVVVADTRMNEDEVESMSPFEGNRLANARTRFVIDAINRIWSPPALSGRTPPHSGGDRIPRCHRSRPPDRTDR